MPLAETDLDKIMKTKPVNITGGEDSTNGNEKENSFQCMKQSENFEHEVNLPIDNNKPDDASEIGRAEIEPQYDSGAQEAQKALKLSLTLPASCYATMAIRELLKSSTSVCTKFKNQSSCLIKATYICVLSIYYFHASAGCISENFKHIELISRPRDMPTVFLGKEVLKFNKE